jgi:hypothetical protein
VNLISSGSVVPDGLRVGSEFASIITVETWDPANNEINVAHGQTVSAKMDTDNSVEKEVLYDEGADFETGTHNSTVTVGDQIELGTDSPTVDFEDYINNTTLFSGSQPDDWQRTDQKADSNTNIRTDPDDSENQCVRCEVNNSVLSARFDEAGTMEGGTIRARFRLENHANNPRFKIMFGITGSGTAMRGYCVEWTRNSSFAVQQRVNDWDSFYGLSSRSIGFTIQDETWYWGYVRWWQTATNTEWRWKVWADGDAEPGTEQWGDSDSTHKQDGYVGAICSMPSAWMYVWWDDFAVIPSPATYFSSGDWQTGILDVTSVTGYSHGLITWDETTPTDTTVAVKARWPNGSWLACTNNDKLPGIIYTEKMVSGSGHDELEVKVELSTTDTSATPDVSNLRVYFEPLRIEEIDLDVDSNSHTIANDRLAWWGRGWIGPGDASGDPPTLEANWDDIFAATKYAWFANDGETITAILKYYSNTIDTITFTAEESKFRMAYLRGSFVVLDPAFIAGPNVFQYTTLTPWFPIGHDYYWIMLDKQQAMHADGYYIVGHYQLNDHIGSLLAADPVLNDHPGSMLAEAYKLDDFLGHALVQGWKLDDQPGMVLPAVEYFNDLIGAVNVGVVEVHDHPGSFVLYGTNKDGSIFVNVIDDDTYQALLDAGITFS